MRRRASVAAVLLVAIASTTVVMRPNIARAQAGIQFSIQPANSNSADATKGAYFSYTISPGGTVGDTALVTNSGDRPITLKLYSADGVTAIGGGTAFAADGERRFGVLSWLSASASEVTAAPGQRVSVPFSVNVPSDALAGDHVAGLVVEAPPRPGTAGGVGTSVVERAGVAIVVRVPGSAAGDLAVADLCMNQETGSNYVQMSVANAGAALTKASGTLTLRDKNAREIFTQPFDVGTVLPADGTFIRVDAPVDPGAGDFAADVTLHQSDGRDVHETAGISIKKGANGCANVSDVSPATAVARRAPAAAASDSGGGPPWLTIGLGGLAVLFAILFLLSLRGRRRRRQNPTA